MTQLELFIYNNGYVTAERQEQVEQNLRTFVKLVREREREKEDRSKENGMMFNCVAEAFNEIVSEFGLEKG